MVMTDCYTLNDTCARVYTGQYRISVYGAQIILDVQSACVICYGTKYMDMLRIVDLT